MQRVQDGELPARYAEPWRGAFMDRVRPVLRDNMTILDVGAGRRPTIPVAWRPPHTQYLGLDISGSELAAAEPDTYSQTIIGDVGERIDKLAGEVDLIVCWQVLEHVADLSASFANMKCYLRPGGRMVALFSGSYAAFALIARVMPHSLRSAVMLRALGTEPETKFRVRYDKCHHKPVTDLLGCWSMHEIVPLYRGASYFSPWRPVERLYLAYEDWLVRANRKNLASHYLVVGDL